MFCLRPIANINRDSWCCFTFTRQGDAKARTMKEVHDWNFFGESARPARLTFDEVYSKVILSEIKVDFSA